MRPSLTIGAVSIYDDFLSDDVANQLWAMMNAIPYSWSDAQRWSKVWTLADGPILRSQQLDAAAPNWQFALPQEPGKPIPSPPMPLIRLLERLKEVLKNQDNIPEVKRISMLPYVWPPKSSISWHCDGTASDPTRIGAFSYYAHKHWNAEWGGEFLLTEIDSQHPQSPFDNTEVSEAIISRGHGFWSSPKPNRLVINPSNMYHKVAKTTEAAAPRMSIQGFLHSASKSG
jgi:hypothetical protein